MSGRAVVWDGERAEGVGTIRGPRGKRGVHPAGHGDRAEMRGPCVGEGSFSDSEIGVEIDCRGVDVLVSEPEDFAILLVLARLELRLGQDYLDLLSSWRFGMSGVSAQSAGRHNVHRICNIMAEPPKDPTLHKCIRKAYWTALDEAQDPSDAEHRL